MLKVDQETQCEILISKNLKEYFFKIKENNILKEENQIMQEELAHALRETELAKEELDFKA